MLIFKEFFKKPPKNLFDFFCIFELAKQFSMCTDFFINFYFKNDWVIAVWKFQRWISSQHKMWRGSVCAPYAGTIIKFCVWFSFYNIHCTIKCRTCICSSLLQMVMAYTEINKSTCWRLCRSADHLIGSAVLFWNPYLF